MNLSTCLYPYASTSSQRDDSREFFAFMLPPEKRWFTPKEVAALIGTSDQFVRDAFDDQRILGHFNIVPGRGPKGRRLYRIHRESLLLYLLETANFAPADFAARVDELLQNRSPAHLQQIRERLDRYLAKEKSG